MLPFDDLEEEKIKQHVDTIFYELTKQLQKKLVKYIMGRIRNALGHFRYHNKIMPNYTIKYKEIDTPNRIGVKFIVELYFDSKTLESIKNYLRKEIITKRTDVKTRINVLKKIIMDEMRTIGHGISAVHQGATETLIEVGGSGSEIRHKKRRLDHKDVGETLARRDSGIEITDVDEKSDEEQTKE